MGLWYRTLRIKFGKKMIHKKCRGGSYPFSQINRFMVPDNLISWSVNFENYDPPEYESTTLINKVWADPPITDTSFKPKWNDLDGKINRKSYTGAYKISENRPLNPIGRTGIKGRGVLGKWGPNHAADPIVTRWKRVNGIKLLDSETNKYILQFCAIQRRDCDEWALPGGMVDPGESVTETLKREFMEEALNSLETEKSKAELKMIENFFKNGIQIYKGYVDDPRNTDNAWMETIAVNFHDEDGSKVGKFNLTAGDDAKNVRWMDVNQNLNLYANHSEFVKKVAENWNAHW